MVAIEAFVSIRGQDKVPDIGEPVRLLCPNGHGDAAVPDADATEVYLTEVAFRRRMRSVRRK